VGQDVLCLTRSDEHLDKLYQAEQAESRKLIAARSGAGAGATASGTGAAAEPAESREDEARIDQASLRLYEDLADLSIANVRMKDGRYGGKDKEYTFTCVQTVGKQSESGAGIMFQDNCVCRAHTPM
jgi:hypothetical protein